MYISHLTNRGAKIAAANKSAINKIKQILLKTSDLDSLHIVMTIPFLILKSQNTNEKEWSFCASIVVPVRGTIGTLPRV